MLCGREGIAGSLSLPSIYMELPISVSSRMLETCSGEPGEGEGFALVFSLGVSPISLVGGVGVVKTPASPGHDVLSALRFSSPFQEQSRL